MLETKEKETLKKIFSNYNYIMTTTELNLEKIYYRDIQKMLESGVI